MSKGYKNIKLIFVGLFIIIFNNFKAFMCTNPTKVGLYSTTGVLRNNIKALRVFWRFGGLNLTRDNFFEQIV